jgi:hypothetical protein
MVPAVGIEPTRSQAPRDFESRASTSSTTPAQNKRKFRTQMNADFQDSIKIRMFFRLYAQICIP